ncbi:hypothetical protein [Cryobacterium lyxosi]|uniref:Uncharacterized protein n=1 Tax=Cryobacterium lyxosi TaxID=1259228 RepID=A0A4R8ZFV6_9MICO|nr:hypothetical protein [Cryobacterium lyxosi]TFD26640.1 hypothetical protein E3T27_07665 [Cryobacterium lyxosi]
MDLNAGTTQFNYFGRRMLEVGAFLKHQDDDFRPERIVIVDREARLADGESEKLAALHCRGGWPGVELVLVDPGPWVGMTMGSVRQVCQALKLNDPSPSGHTADLAGFEENPEGLF